MNRLNMIIKLIFRKKIIVYNNWTKEVICIIGNDKDLLKKRFTYDFIGSEESCLELKDDNLYYIKENENDRIN